MALYKNGVFLTHSLDPVFDQLLAPGATVPCSGIYRCTGCGREVASVKVV